MDIYHQIKYRNITLQRMYSHTRETRLSWSGGRLRGRA